MKATVVCSMRNEGPYIVEWVAWQRMLGFTDIVVVSNDCTDHSCELLDALERAGVVVHLRCDVKYGEKVTAKKLRMAHAHPAVSSADWVFVCDVDEFLVIHRGNGLLPDLLGNAPDFLVMVINWQVFGMSDLDHWQDGLVHRQFLRTGIMLPKKSGVFGWIKALFCRPNWFAALGEHGPWGLDVAKTGKKWGDAGLRCVNARGEDIPNWAPNGDYLRHVPRKMTAHEVAQLNHYMLKSGETWRLKQGSISAVDAADRYGEGYYLKFNRNECKDLSALTYQKRFDPVHQELMDMPAVRLLHHQCCVDYVTRIAKNEGHDVNEDPRYDRHMRLMDDIKKTL